MDPKTMLEKSHDVLVSLAPSFKERDLQTAFALFSALKKLGKEAHLEGTSKAPATEKTFAVSLKGLAPFVSRMHYEKDDKDLKLFFTLQQGNISLENLSVQTPSAPDLTIIVGNGEDAHNRELRDLVFTLLSPADTPLVQLAGLLFAKLETIQEKKIAVAFLSQKDFAECQASPKMLSRVMHDMKSYAEHTPSLLVVYESSSSDDLANAVLLSPSQKLRQTVLTFGGGQEKGDWVLVTPLQKSMEDIKKELGEFHG